ncbi:hypothetical protein ACFQL4_04625 [Halosimplex aquaticum]
MTSVVEATAEGDADDDRDPFGGARIEVPEGRCGQSRNHRSWSAAPSER